MCDYCKRFGRKKEQIFSFRKTDIFSSFTQLKSKNLTCLSEELLHDYYYLLSHVFQKMNSNCEKYIGIFHNY